MCFKVVAVAFTESNDSEKSQVAKIIIKQRSDKTLTKWLHIISPVIFVIRSVRVSVRDRVTLTLV